MVYLLLVSSESKTSDVTHNFVAGDVVEVFQDALVGLQGTVVKVDGNQVMIKAKHEELQVCLQILIFSFYKKNLDMCCFLGQFFKFSLLLELTVIN